MPARQKPPQQSVTILTALTRKPPPDRIWIAGVARIPSTPFRLNSDGFCSDSGGLGVSPVKEMVWSCFSVRFAVPVQPPGQEVRERARRRMIRRAIVPAARRHSAHSPTFERMKRSISPSTKKPASARKRLVSLPRLGRIPVRRAWSNSPSTPATAKPWRRAASPHSIPAFN